MPYGQDPLADTGATSAAPGAPYQFYQQTGQVPIGTPPSIPPSSPAQTVQRDVITDFWQNKGVPDFVAEGIADATHDESGVKGNPNLFNPTAVNPTSGATGLQQDLGPRKTQLQSQPNWQDPQVQLDNAYREVTGGDKQAAAHWDEIKNAPTREAAAALWKKYFERPGPGGAPSGGYGAADQAISAPGWNVAPEAIASEQSSGADVRWMTPQQYLDLTPVPPENAEQTAKAKSLNKSLQAGENVEAIPTLDVKMQGDKATVYDQDGRNRAVAAQQAGVGLIPVAVKGIGAGTSPAQIQGMRGGEAIPFNFRPIGKIELPPKPTESQSLVSSITAKIGKAALDAARDTALAFGHVAAGAAQVPVGIAQLAAHGVNLAENIAHVPGVPVVPGAADAVSRGLDTAADVLGRFANSGDMSQRGAAMIGNLGATAFLPGAGVTRGAGALKAILEAARGGAIAGAAQPVVGPPGDYWASKAVQTGEGAAFGGGVGAAGAALGGAANLASRVVTPGTLTQAATRLFGPKASEVTPKLLNDAKLRIGGAMNVFELSHDIKVDNTLATKLIKIATDAQNTLGDKVGPIAKELNTISSLMKGGKIPGKSAATLWHQGSKLDDLTESKNSDIASFATDIQGSLRNALQRQLPPGEAEIYSALRSQYRDMKLVSRAMGPQLGAKGVIPPRSYVAAVKKKFPNAPEIVNAPPALELGRAAAQTWKPGAGGMLGGAIGAILGGLGGPISSVTGGVLGSAAGRIAMDRLTMLRLAPKAAMPALRPGPPGMTANVLGQVSQRAPQFAAPGAALGLQLQGAL